MHWRKYFDSERVGSWDIGERDVTVTITKVESTEVYDRKTRGKKKMPLISLKGKKKKLLANVTNCGIIEAMYGEDTDGWTGKAITLYVKNNRLSSGETVKGISVRGKKPAGSKPDGEFRDYEPPHDEDTGEVYEDGEVPPDQEPPERGGE